MYISVILPTRDSVESTDTTVGTLTANPFFLKEQYEILVVNDGASPAINEYVHKKKAMGLNIHSIEIKKSKGSYHARNQGIEKAHGEYLLFFDVPITIHKEWFLPFIELLKNNDYVAGDIKVNPNECHTIAEKMYAATAFPVESYFHQQHFGPTAFLGVKREVFDKVGLFSILYSGGDMEFGQRVHHAGFKMAFFDTFPALHSTRNLQQQFWKKVRAYAGIYSMYKNNPGSKVNPVRIKSLLSCVVAIPANWVKFRQNKIYQTGWFTYPQYLMAIVQFWGVDFLARLYVAMNKEKKMNT